MPRLGPTSRSLVRDCVRHIEARAPGSARETALALASRGAPSDIAAASRVLYLLRDYHGALHSVSTASPPLLAHRYSMLKRLRFEVEADETIRALVASEPGPRVHRAATHHFRTTGQEREALALLEKTTGPRADARAWIDHADLAVRANAADEVVRAARAAVVADPRVIDSAASLLLQVGAYDQARRLADEHEPAGETTLARLALLIGDHETAQRLAGAALARAPDNARALEAAIGAAVLGRHTDRARALLGHVDAPSPTVQVWKGQLALDTGNTAEAIAALTAARDAVPDYIAAKLLLVLARPPDRDVPRYGLEGLLVGQLDSLGANLSAQTEAVSSEKIVHAARVALDRLAGNRTPWPSVVENGRPRRVWPPANPRHRVRRLQHTAAYLGIERAIELVEAELDHSNPIALCYRGELDLWAGRYDDAAAWFERSLALRRTTVWAWIGLGAARTLAGDPTEGLARIDEGVEVVGWRGATVPIYRAEALYCLGRHAEALDELADADKQNPDRIATAVLRVLALNALDQPTEPAFRELDARAPALIADAAYSLGLAPWWPTDLDSAEHARVAAAALRLCRGNRSSSCALWFEPTSEVVRTYVPGRPSTTPAWEADELAALRNIAG